MKADELLLTISTSSSPADPSPLISVGNRYPVRKTDASFLTLITSEISTNVS